MKCISCHKEVDNTDSITFQCMDCFKPKSLKKELEKERINNIIKYNRPFGHCNRPIEFSEYDLPISHAERGRV